MSNYEWFPPIHQCPSCGVMHDYEDEIYECPDCEKRICTDCEDKHLDEVNLNEVEV